jgi:hypothetical protein
MAPMNEGKEVYFALYTKSGLFLSYQPHTGKYAIYRSAKHLKIWDFFKKQDEPHFFASQPKPAFYFEVRPVEQGQRRFVIRY